MSKRKITLLWSVLMIVCGVLGLATLPAQAAVYHVPSITCEHVDTCDESYVGASDGHQGYWMARRFDHPGVWVRQSMVAGWDNTYVAQITCLTYDSCILGYYTPTHGELGYYWMLRQAAGTTWVRTSLIPGVAA